MAFKGTRSRSKKKRQSFSRRRRNPPAFGRAPARNVRIAGFLGIETKFYDTALAASALVTNTAGAGGEKDQSATIGPSTITQGDGEQQRDGLKATLISMHVQGLITCTSAVDQTGMKPATSIFIAIVWDKQTNGALLNSEDVYLNPSGNAFGGTSLVRNLQQSHRFQVMATRKMTINMPNSSYDGTNIESGGVLKPFNIFIKFKTPIIARYSGTTETIANSVDNSLHILAWCTTTGLAPLITYNCRMRFRG